MTAIPRSSAGEGGDPFFRLIMIGIDLQNLPPVAERGRRLSMPFFEAGEPLEEPKPISIGAWGQ